MKGPSLSVYVRSPRDLQKYAPLCLLIHPTGGSNAHALANLHGVGGTNAVDITQSDDDPFVGR